MATILLIEEDDDARPIIRQNLRRAGHELLVAVDEASARDWREAGGARADLILVNLVGKTTGEAFAAARRVKQQNALDGSTPVVVIAETALKTPWRTAGPAPSTSELISSTTTIKDARATTISPMRNSSSRLKRRGRRPTMPA